MKESNGFRLILEEHLAGQRKNLLCHAGAGKEADTFTRVRAMSLFGISQNKDR